MKETEFVEIQVKKLRKALGRIDSFSRLQLLDTYRAGLYGGIKFGKEIEK
jgi:hypothetical protein